MPTHETKNTGRSLRQGMKKERILSLILIILSVLCIGCGVAWEDNESVDALKELARDGLSIPMSMYGGFEQVGPIGKDLPREDRQTTTQAGDIVLYSGNQLVIFYGSNSWAYTRLGKIVDKSASELTELLGSGDAAVTLTME